MMGWGEGPLHTPLCCSYCHEKPPQFLVLVRWHPGGAKRPFFWQGEFDQIQVVSWRRWSRFKWDVHPWGLGHVVTHHSKLFHREVSKDVAALIVHHRLSWVYLLSRALWSTLGVEPYQDTVTYRRGNKCKNKKAYEDSANSLRYHFSSDVACNSYSWRWESVAVYKGCVKGWGHWFQTLFLQPERCCLW